MPNPAMKRAALNHSGSFARPAAAVKTLKSPPYTHADYARYEGAQPLIGFFRVDGDARAGAQPR